ncbi:MAG: DUF2721 domain-containing protein [Methylococcales bacterium]
MDVQLASIVDLVTGSLVLFSSIGIFVLTLNARYTHAIGRVREIYDELNSKHNLSKLEKELDMFVYRCQLLKWSFALLIASGLSSSLFLLGSIFSHFVGHINAEVLVIMVVLSVLFIFGSMLFLFMDVLKSFRATLIHIGRAKS